MGVLLIFYCKYELDYWIDYLLLSAVDTKVINLFLLQTRIKLVNELPFQGLELSVADCV
jgi:hypothetical protein